MKACFKCGDTKPLYDFYEHPMMRDGHLNKCKECTKKDMKRDYRCNVKNPEWAKKERARCREKFRRLHKNWNHDKGAAQEANRRWYHLNIHKKRAHSQLRRAILSGAVTKPKTCQRCGTQPTPKDLHGHHHDYGKPLDVEWICTSCHGIEHRAA